MTPPVRIARVIARLNVGGPARHVLAAACGLAPEHETTLLAGRVADGETEATGWIRASGVTPETVPGLGRAVRPFDDLRALSHLTRRFREIAPHVVHTHTAKAGALGRVAARRAGVPHVVHTFHGHVFDGYFGRAATAAVVAAERWLARRTERIVAVSAEVADDLVRHGIATRDRIDVIAPGIDVAAFAAARTRRDGARRALGFTEADEVVVWTGRLVPVKEPGTAIDVIRAVRTARPRAVLVVAGEGPLRPALGDGREPGVRVLGHVGDMAAFLAAADCALLTSRNEGTPVALIEAAAAGVPGVAMRVGGVASVVADGVTGRLAPRGDVAALASHVVALLSDAGLRASLGAAARERAAALWSEERMLRDLRDLYASMR